MNLPRHSPAIVLLLMLTAMAAVPRDVMAQATPGWHKVLIGDAWHDAYGTMDARGIVTYDPASLDRKAVMPPVPPAPPAPDRVHAPGPAPTPAPPAPTPMEGVTVDRSGQLNAGVNLESVQARAGQLDTNDSEFGQRFFDLMPSGGVNVRDAAPDPAAGDRPSPSDRPDFPLPVLVLGAALILALFGLVRRKA